MKKTGILLLMLAVLVALSGCASNSAEKQSAVVTAAPAATAAAEVKPDEILMKKLLDTIGDDLMARCKAANFQLNTKFRHYDYAPNEGWKPGENDYTDDLLFVTVEIYAPKNPGERADSELMRELQYAVIDSDIFTLTEEEKAELKSLFYSAEKREARMTVKDPTVELHFLEFDKNAVLTINGLDNSLKTRAHREDWYRTYQWGELSR